MLRKSCTISWLAIIFVLASCSDVPPGGSDKGSSTASASASAGPVSGKTAFWEMYKQAHTWAADLVPLTLESKSVPGIKNEAGKAAMWTATFGSPGKHEARVFTYAVSAHAPDIYKGVTVGNSLPWGGPTGNVMPFETSDIATDSDAAYKAALSEASAWVDKHPDKEFSCSLGNASRFPAPVWYVLWGNAKDGYAAFINAKTGAVIHPKGK